MQVFKTEMPLFIALAMSMAIKGLNYSNYVLANQKILLIYFQPSSSINLIFHSFDEVYTKKDLAYDARADQFIGPHNRANVMMLR